jgi:F-type H+-transporting ATPase subunit b
MKSGLATISLIATVVFWPAWLFAAEPEQTDGSWFPLTFYVINFLIFLWILRRYAWPRIAQFFRDRSQSIRDTRTRAEKAYQDAQALANLAVEQLEQLEADKRKMTAELNEETASQVRQISQAASEAASRIRRDTQMTTIALREGAQRRLRQAMAEAAGRIARELVSDNFEASDQARLLGGFVDRIGEEARA